MASVKKVPIQSPRSHQEPEGSLILKRLEKLKMMYHRCEMFNPILIEASNRSRASSTSGELSDEADERQRVRQVLMDMDWLEDFLKGTPGSDPTNSINAVDYINARMTGNTRLQRAAFDRDHATKRIIQHGLFKERVLDLDFTNKVFCSQWLSDHEVIIGTKCNTIKVLNVKDNKAITIPNIRSSNKSHPPQHPCGIHAIELNPSKTMVATSGENANDIAVYKLPSLEPLCVGERTHTDYIFDLKWLDDEFLVSGSRDSTIALWQIKTDSPFPKAGSSKAWSGSGTRPVIVRSAIKKNIKDADKIRQVLYNEERKEIVALSLNARLHTIDIHTLTVKESHGLRILQENVCLAQSFEYKMYAVGSKSIISLIDPRKLDLRDKISSSYPHCGIRSLSFNRDLLTIGTGNGHVLFWDVRMKKYLHQRERLGIAVANDATCSLSCDEGYINRDLNFFDTYNTIEYNPAIYTHCYDYSRTKLFTAGGPLPASISGNYAALWS